MWVSRKEWERVSQGHAMLASNEKGLMDLVERLEMQVTELKMALDVEKKRADKAVDRILQLAGSAPISQSDHKTPSVEDLDGMFKEDPAVVRELRRAIKEKGPEAVLFDDSETEVGE